MKLSDRGYWIIGLTTLLGISGQWVGGAAAQFWVLPAALLVAALYAERAALPAQQFRVSREVPARAHLGEPFRGQLRLHNGGARVLRVEFEADFPAFFRSGQRNRDDAVDHSVIPPGESRGHDFRLTPLELGSSRLGTLHLRVLGFLGLVWWHRRHDDEVTVVATPRAVTQVSRGAGDNLAGARYSRKPVPGGLEFHSHRGYQPGDPLQTIDWKASARSDDLIVRVMTREQRMEIAILLDCGRTSQVVSGELSRMHHHVNVAARLAELAVRYGDRVSLVAYADRPLAVVPLSGGVDGLRRMRARLADMRARPLESNLLSAALQARRLLGHRALVIVLTDPAAGEETSQFRRATGLLAARHHTVIAGIQNADIRALRWARPSSWLDPYRSLAAMEYCRERELANRQLKHSGATVIDAPADELDDKVLEHYRMLRQQSSV